MPAEGAVVVTILSERFCGLQTHWDADLRQRTPCLGEARCSYCRSGFKPHWYAFAAAWQHPMGRLVLAAVPQAAWLANPRLEAALDDARGVQLRLTRLRSHSTGPVLVQVAPERVRRDSLPAGWDLQADLCHRFGFETVHLFDQDSDPAEELQPPPGAEGGF